MKPIFCMWRLTALFTDEFPDPALHNLLQLHQVEIVQVNLNQDD